MNPERSIPSRPAETPSRGASEGDVNTSENRAEWQSRQLDGQTQRWLQADAACFLHQSLSTPCLNVLKGCQGSYLEDLQGKRYLDFHGNNVHQVGFAHPKVVEAIVQQLGELSFCTRRYTNLPAIRLAEKLVKLAPDPLSRVLFAPGGTTAIGMALKLARMATGRFKTVSLWDSFHGASLDAISIGGESLFREGVGPLLSGAEHAPPPDPRHCPWHCGHTCGLHCADYIEYMLEKERDVAAVIAETVRCTPFIPPKDYWQRIRKACDKHGALLILDEVPICLGRTGKMFAFEHYEIVPDMVVMGKGLGGGIFPLAAVIAREELNCCSHVALGHYTHEKSPVGAAAALAAIEVIEQEELLAHATQLGKVALERMGGMMGRYPCIGDVRGLGLLMGMELVRDRASMEKDEDLADAVLYESLGNGLSFKTTMGNILTLTPPLTISEEALRHAFDILEAAIASKSSKD